MGKFPWIFYPQFPTALRKSQQQTAETYLFHSPPFNPFPVVLIEIKGSFSLLFLYFPEFVVQNPLTFELNLLIPSHAVQTLCDRAGRFPTPVAGLNSVQLYGE